MTAYDLDSMGATCDGCGIAPTRRAFLRDVLSAAAGVALTLGISSAAAAELPVRMTTALRRAGHTRSYPIPATDGVQIDRDEQVILVRWTNAVYAFNLSCPHQNTALRWDEADHRFQCPKHHSKYQPSGEFIEGRATRSMDRFSVAQDGANVVVDLDAMHRQDQDPAGWTAAVVHIGPHGAA